MSKENEYFNCSEDYENEYVSSLYVKKEKVSETLTTWCENGTIKNTKHSELYVMLEKAGYTKK
jgi:hypothetical protein